ncbi:hypothetical protein VF21_03345 [Pseudogymnoascus sp. 05NY08]|nr:hypothetical protein VF21_03345 [Pseudogymnoascus sp. 05NY08]
MVEHRYWGESSPYEVLDAEAFRYLTVDQTIADYTRFARAVKLPFDMDASSNAPQAYYDLIRTAMPQNCSQDFVRIAQHVGDTITTGDPAEVAHLKDMFGTGALNDDDFARALVLGLDNWQIEMLSNVGTTSLFLSMCDAVEGAVEGVPGSAIPEEGVGLEKALPNFASWFKTDFIANRCMGAVLFSNTDNLTLYEDWLSPNSVACLDWTLNATSSGVIDLSPNSPRDRRYWWLTCNEPTLRTFQVPPPDDRPSLISRTITTDYAAGICSRLFPADKGYKYGLANGRTAETVNAHTGGWDYTDSTRLMWSNGEFDQWGTRGVSSKFRPGGPLQSTEEVPVFVVPGGHHCSDSFLSQSVNPGVKTVQEAEIAYIKKWVAEFYDQKSSTWFRGR